MQPDTNTTPFSVITADYLWKNLRDDPDTAILIMNCEIAMSMGMPCQCGRHCEATPADKRES